MQTTKLSLRRTTITGYNSEDTDYVTATEDVESDDDEEDDEVF